LQSDLAPSPVGQIRWEWIWSQGERPQGSGQDSPETLGWGEEIKINHLHFPSSQPSPSREGATTLV